MSDAAERDDTDISHPRDTYEFSGHDAAERQLLDAYRSGRIAHAWLIGGPHGIGKATLAYRMARFVLAHPDPGAPDVQAARSLAVDPQNITARRIAAQSHPDLLVLERTLGDTGKLKRFIEVDEVRRSVTFFGSTAGEGGWRVAIVDSVDELNASGENAFLKILEEPPPRSLLLLVSHAPGRLLATIRSRCRRLMLDPLVTDAVAAIAAHAVGRSVSDPEIVEAATASDGSVARALSLLDGQALKLRHSVVAMLDRLPALDARALHALGDALSGSDPRTLAAVVDTVNGWLSAQLARNTADRGRALALAEAWERSNQAAREAEAFNLDRKPLIFNMFGLLAEAARG